MSLDHGTYSWDVRPYRFLIPTRDFGYPALPMYQLGSMVAGVITNRVHETNVFTLLIYCKNSNKMVLKYNTIEYLGVAKTASQWVNNRFIVMKGTL